MRKAAFFLIIGFPIFLSGNGYADPPLNDTSVPRPVFYWWAGRQDVNAPPYLEISTQGLVATQIINIGNTYGRIGRMANFNGVADGNGSRFCFGISTSLKTCEGITLAVWGRLNSSNNNAGILVVENGDNEEKASIVYRFNPTPKMCIETTNTTVGRIQRCGSTEFFSTNPSTGIGNDQYFFYIGRVRIGEILADVNGKPDLIDAPPPNINPTTPSPQVDRIIVGNFDFSGEYNGQPSPPMDLRAALIWDTFLSSAQVNAVYQTIVNGGAQKW